MGILDKSEQFEELLLVLVTDSDASVLNRDLDKLAVILFIFYNSHRDFDTSLGREFQSIRLQSQKNLHDPLFVTPYDWAKFTQRNNHLILSYIQILDLEIYALFLCIKSLDSHNLFNALPYIKLCYIFSEFTRLNLCIIKKVLNHIAH